MPIPPRGPKTVLEIILEWSADRPDWQRDALRRIVQAQKLTETDLPELVALCKRGHTPTPSQTEPEAKPLLAAHLPANPGAGASVSLTAIQDVAAVNNLAPAQNLTFAPNGITVVFGDNVPENQAMRASSSVLAALVTGSHSLERVWRACDDSRIRDLLLHRRRRFATSGGLEG